MKSLSESHGVAGKKPGTGGEAKGKLASFFIFMLVLLILPSGTAFFFALDDFINGSWKEGITTFLGVLTIGFLIELFSYLIFRWKNPD